MILFQKLLLQNFLSHEHSEVTLENRGLVLLQGINSDNGGSNGAGKSSVISSLVWALYGVEPEGLKSDEVIRDGQVWCSVSITGLKDKAQFGIIRTRGPAGLSIVVNGNDLSGPSIKSTQEKIDSFLGLDYQSFTSTVLFPQGSKGIASLPQAEQRAILGKILDLDRFDAAHEKSKVNRNTLRETLADQEAAFLRTQTSVESELRHLEQLEESKASFKREKERRLKALKAELSKSKTPEISGDILDELRALESEDPLHLNQRVSAEFALRDRALQGTLTRIASTKAKYQTLLETLREPQDQSEPACPTCGQDLPQDARKALQERNREALVRFLASRQEYQEALARLDEEEVSCKVQRVALDKEFDGRRKESESKVRHLNELRQIISAFRTADSRRQSLEASIEDEESRCFTGESAIKATKKTIEELKAKLPKIQEQIEEVKDKLAYADFWHEAFGATGLRHYYLASITPYLSDRANYYLQQLTGGTGKLSITTQRETKKGTLSDELTIEAELGGGKSYKAKSGGEKRRIDIALLFALAELMSTKARVQVDLLILDESLDGVDAEGSGAVIRMLRDEIGKHKGTIILISHNDSLTSEVGEVIKVVKQNDISRIAE